jgi:2-oxoisovalerate dehydrogenase E1 component
MFTIRRFEERAGELYASGHVPGFVHLSIGQEASAVGACWPLGRGDVITSTHRGHGHCIAKGLAPGPMLAELMGRAGGVCGGLGGSMHIADPRLGIFGANGIVAAGLPLATGAAAARRAQGRGEVVVAFFGDGAVAQGAFHESLELASSWDLPVIYFCEDNQYAEFSRSADQQRGSLEGRAAGYGVGYAEVDGNDVEAVAALMTDLVAGARAGAGPSIVRAATYRWRGHYEGDPEHYRESEELAAWKARDPLALTRRRLVEAGVADAELAAVSEQVERLIEDGVAAALAAPPPEADATLRHVRAPRPEVSEPPEADGEEFCTMDAISLALEHALEEDETVLVAGVDVGAGGNVFGLTRGLAERFPDRVRDTPIAETAIVGLAIGAAMAGMRPVVEVMYLDFIGVCFDQLMNQAAKLHFMTGGNASLPLVVRTQFGAGRSSGSQHSQSLEALLAHLPGLTVVMPSTPAEAYGLLRAAIADPNPVVVIENRRLYGQRGPRPERGALVPIGRARIVRPGRHVTLVSYSRLVHECLASAEELATEGVEVEVIDLRTVSPLDRATVLASLERSGRLVIAHEAVRDFGVGAELAALAADEGFHLLDAPVVRVGAACSPPPYAPNLEAAWLPGREAITEALRRTAAF